MVGWPTSANLPGLEPVPSPGLSQAQGLPKDEGKFISVGFAALHPPYVAGQMGIAGDGAEIYKVSYVRGQHEALQGTAIIVPKPYSLNLGLYYLVWSFYFGRPVLTFFTYPLKPKAHSTLVLMYSDNSWGSKLLAHFSSRCNVTFAGMWLFSIFKISSEVLILLCIIIKSI